MSNPRDHYGIYPDVELECASMQTPRSLTSAYYWSQTIAGTMLVDVPHEELPPLELLTGGYLTVCDADGEQIVAGEITEIGMTDGIGGLTTLVLIDPESENDPTQIADSPW